MTQSVDPALHARAAALKLLEAALNRRGGLDEALSTPGLAGLSPQDRAFARALTMATLRHLGPIDRALDTKLSREPPSPARNLLRLGLAQAYWLDTPQFAAVDTTVSLSPKPLRGLVNAVLRGILRGEAPTTEPEALVPPWLFSRWCAAFGTAQANAIATQILHEPATDLTLRDASDNEVADLVEAQALPGGSLRTPRRGDIATWPGYAEGRWWVQDAAAAIPVRLMSLQSGQTALDLCAAPGGKTLQMAAAGAQVTALDRLPARVQRLQDNLKRMSLRAETVTADAIAWRDERQFDAVLLDAPCSATGTFRRHPDVLWNARPADIASLAQVQAALLASAARRTKPGGCLVYSVCSLESEEGEGQVRSFLNHRSDFAISPMTAGEGAAPSASLTPEGWLRILPHQAEGGLDGFFIARLRRVS